ncbi:MAG: hypothetical protein WCG05_00440 [Alphaproteobacteria bacterium]
MTIKIFFLILITVVAGTESKSDCHGVKCEQFCNMRPPCKWTSWGCVVGKRPNDAETSILSNWGIHGIEMPAPEEDKDK